jgi:hypothetical protein
VPNLTVMSAVSAETFEPFVKVEWKGPRVGQLSPAEARIQAAAFLEAAEAAEQDASFYRFLVGNLELGREQASLMVLNLRAWREQERKQ